MRDPVDELLDRAIAEYLEAPRPGLEQRVLRRVRSEGRTLMPVWALAAVVSVCLLAFVLTRTDRVPETVHSGTQMPPALHMAQAAQSPQVHRVQKAARAVLPPALPKRATFPTPTPLSDGERALLSLSKRHPEMAAAVATRLNKTLEQLEIEPLEIRPLITEGGQGSQ
jgi:hypothetical protein